MDHYVRNVIVPFEQDTRKICTLMPITGGQCTSTTLKPNVQMEFCSCYHLLEQSTIPAALKPFRVISGLASM